MLAPSQRNIPTKPEETTVATLAERIEAHAKARPANPVLLSDFLASDVEGSIRIRSLNVTEESEAAKNAVEFRRSLLTQLPEKFVREFLEDPSFLDDIRTVEKLWRACRNHDDVDQPAFPSAAWMRDNMTRDELATLFGFYSQAVIAANRTKSPLDRDQVLFLAHACAANAETDAGDAIVMRLEKPVLADLFVRLSVEYVKAAAAAAVNDSDAKAS
jgi:hypothetical protein